MVVEKKIITNLTKCYSLAELSCGGQRKYLVASEKEHECLLLNSDFSVEQRVWDGPGGTMTMEPYPDADGVFLATQYFYSPNDSAKAEIVLVQRQANGWDTHTVWKLPFVHRFGILRAQGKLYLIAATLKSAHAYKEDWTCPGRVWVAQLPKDPEKLTQENAPELRPLISGLLRNHGFWKCRGCESGSVLIGAENGIYRVTAPQNGSDWAVTCILKVPASDMLEADLDGDGQDELLVLSPFHGDRLTIYKQAEGKYAPVYFFEKPLPFLHALDVGYLNGRAVAVIGHRKGDRDLLLIYEKNGEYCAEVLDHDIGPANVHCLDGKDGLRILSANREIDEVALYTVTTSESLW